MRRNADEDLRELERAAAGGDRDAQARLFRAKQRAGRPGDVTIAEIAASATGDVEAFLRGLPAELGGPFWSARIGARPLGQPLPAMTHEQIARSVGDGMSGWPQWYERLIQEEAEARALRSGGPGRGRRRSASAFIEDAQTAYASEVSRFLEEPRSLELPDFFSYRAPRIYGWAIAERIRQVLRERADAAPTSPAVGEPLWEIEDVNGDTLEREEDWTIRLVDQHGNTDNVWQVGDEGWADMAAHFGVNLQTIRVPCPEGCETEDGGTEQVRWRAARCRVCGPSPALARLFRAEIDNEEHGGHSPTTLDSTLDSLEQGYEPNEQDDMAAVEAELRDAIDRLGGNTVVTDAWTEAFIRETASL